MRVVDVPAFPGGPGRAPRIVRGTSVPDAWGPELDALHEAVGAHVMARRPWLQACLEHDDRYTPLAVAVPGDDGSLEAAALLAVRTRGWLWDVAALGTDVPTRRGSPPAPPRRPRRWPTRSWAS